MAVEKVGLASGYQMHKVGFGLWQVPAENMADVVYIVTMALPNFGQSTAVRASTEQVVRPSDLGSDCFIGRTTIRTKRRWVTASDAQLTKVS